jgi:hypothetical protein
MKRALGATAAAALSTVAADLWTGTAHGADARAHTSKNDYGRAVENSRRAHGVAHARRRQPRRGDEGPDGRRAGTADEEDATLTEYVRATAGK